jgi:hypothetical protein
MKTARKRRIDNTAAPEIKPDKLSRLKKRNNLVGDPEDIVHMDWLSEWTEPSKFEPISRSPRKKK